MHAIQPDLTAGPGQLWVQIRLADRFFRDTYDRRLADSISAMLATANLGEWAGESSGNGCMGISYAVPNLQAGAQAVDRLLQQQSPPRWYLISDHYEARFEEPSIGTVGCVAALLSDPAGRILFQQRDNNPAIAFPNYWALPGGHIESGETPEQAITRELWEELEQQEPVAPLIDYVFWRSVGVLVHQYVFVGTIARTIDQIPLHEGQDLRFIPSDQLDQYPIAFGYATVCHWFLARPAKQ